MLCLKFNCLTAAKHLILIMKIRVKKFSSCSSLYLIFGKVLHARSKFNCKIYDHCESELAYILLPLYSPEEGKDAKCTYFIEACTVKMDSTCYKNA